MVVAMSPPPLSSRPCPLRGRYNAAPRGAASTRTARTDCYISARPQVAPRHIPGRSCACSDETGSAAYYTNTCRSHKVTRFSAPTGDAAGFGPGMVDPGCRRRAWTPHRSEAALPVGRRRQPNRILARTLCSGLGSVLPGPRHPGEHLVAPTAWRLVSGRPLRPSQPRPRQAGQQREPGSGGPPRACGPTPPAPRAARPPPKTSAPRVVAVSRSRVGVTGVGECNLAVAGTSS